MYGRLTVEQRAALPRFITGRVVTDFGAGDGSLAVRLVALGAKEVVAVDKHVIRFGVLPKIRPVMSNFDEFREPVDVAFVSWPQQFGTDALARVVAPASIVIYLGSNTDGTVCGHESFWQTLRHRRVMQHIPDRKNTLIVYAGDDVTRPLLPEEFAALNRAKRIYRYEELYPERRAVERSVN